MNSDCISYTAINSKQIRDLNIKIIRDLNIETIKLPEENFRGYLYDQKVGGDFFSKIQDSDS